MISLNSETLMLIYKKIWLPLGMGQNKSILSMILILVFLIGCSKTTNQEQPADGISLYDLTTEGLENPIGIDTSTPKFIWKIAANQNNV